MCNQVESNHSKNWPSNHLIQRLKNVDILDGVSLESNDEGSNTDSGRGPSEIDGLLAAESRAAPTRQSPSAAAPFISASNTVPTMTVLPIKPCLVTDNSRLANHIGELLGLRMRFHWQNGGDPWRRFLPELPPELVKILFRVSDHCFLVEFYVYCCQSATSLIFTVFVGISFL